MNRLDFDPAYPRIPRTPKQHIRKWRMDKGISQASLASRLGVNGMTIVNWEIWGDGACQEAHGKADTGDWGVRTE